MLSNCIERLGHKKTKKNKNKTKQQQTNKEKPRKNKQIKNGNNSTYHEPLSEEWVGRRS